MFQISHKTAELQKFVTVQRVNNFGIWWEISEIMRGNWMSNEFMFQIIFPQLKWAQFLLLLS